MGIIVAFLNRHSALSHNNKKNHIKFKLSLVAKI